MRAAAEERNRNGLIVSLGALWRLIGRRSRRRLIVAIPLMLMAAIAELVTIGAVLPFLALLGGSDGPVPGPLSGLVGALPTDRLALYALLFLAAAALLSAALRLAVLRFTQRATRDIAHHLGAMLFARLLHQPFEAHLRRNPSEVTSAIEKVQVVTMNVLQPLFMAAVAAVTAVGILALLLALEPAAALSAAAVVMLGYLTLSRLSRRRLEANSSLVARSATARFRALQEAIGGIREIILTQSQAGFEARFSKLDFDYRQGQMDTALAGQSPRYLIEAAGVVLISLFILYIANRPGGLVLAIPMLGVVALSAQKMLPLLQQIYSGWSFAAGSLQSVRDLVALLDEPFTSAQAAPVAVQPFQGSIRFEHVSFGYSQDALVLKDIHVNIPKGARVGVVGPSGSGKSTFVNLLSGLLSPTEGRILIDDIPVDRPSVRSWWAQIAVVPQDIYLPDRSIAENIAFGLATAQIDIDRVRRAAEQASIHNFIASLPNSYDTPVGERGVALSGGQRQRIAIARALYRGAKLLIFDEATSALDSAAEAEIMDSVTCLHEDLTLLLVTHRTAPLEACDLVISLPSGRLDASERAVSPLPALERAG